MATFVVLVTVGSCVSWIGGHTSGPAASGSAAKDAEVRFDAHIDANGCWASYTANEGLTPGPFDQGHNLQ